MGILVGTNWESEFSCEQLRQIIEQNLRWMEKEVDDLELQDVLIRRLNLIGNTSMMGW